MTDRELLELAAKAVGIGAYVHCETHAGMIPEHEDEYVFPFNVWNPLTDDGDALRLAISLRINVVHVGGVVDALFEGGCCYQVIGSGDHEHACSSVRRAIVRAAAEIGRTKP